MSTILPPPSKKQKKQLASANEAAQIVPSSQLTISFQSSESGETLKNSLRVPSTISAAQLSQLVNQLQQNEEHVPFEFAVQTKDQLVDVKSTLHDTVISPGIKTVEDHLVVIYTPQAVFRVKPVTRSSAEIAGHGATILSAKFSPVTSSRAVTGSGDFSGKIWDCETQTPVVTLSGHSNWVLTAEYSPDGVYIATGSMDNDIRIWNSSDGKLVTTLQGHSRWITSISWQPLHLNNGVHMLVSGSKDNTARVWNIGSGTCTYTFTGHTNSVSCVKWGGYNHIYTASHDKCVKVWNAADGKNITTLKSHAHWINHLSLSTDYVIRKGCYGHNEADNRRISRLELPEKRSIALKLFEDQMKILKHELMVTASDDFTMFIWDPATKTKPIARMHGHQKLVNHVAFSPDGKYIASASFDNSIKLWNGADGSFVATFRGHVGPVYQICWSGDGRMLVSGSKDTTLKIWDVRTRKLSVDLPGHKDEVYAVDWSVDGRKVVSGGKDRMVRVWRN